jgi:hypothetical protein
MLLQLEASDQLEEKAKAAQACCLFEKPSSFILAWLKIRVFSIFFHNEKIFEKHPFSLYS